LKKDECAEHQEIAPFNGGSLAIIITLLILVFAAILSLLQVGSSIHWSIRGGLQHPPVAHISYIIDAIYRTREILKTKIQGFTPSGELKP
jgi:hypothetical protein